MCPGHANIRIHVISLERFLPRNQSASTNTKNLKVPPCCTPRRNCTFTFAPAGNPPPGKVTVTVVFCPPPSGCAGFRSTVRLSSFVMPVLVAGIVISGDESNLKSACPPPETYPLVLRVVTSTTRNLRREIVCPLIFVKLRLIESVPFGQRP